MLHCGTFCFSGSYMLLCLHSLLGKKKESKKKKGQGQEDNNSISGLADFISQASIPFKVMEPLHSCSYKVL